MSHPSRVRGLKYVINNINKRMCLIVAPFAGAWIEIQAPNELNIKAMVAPFAGAWIEMNNWSSASIALFQSHPSRVRGLKW